MSNGRLGRHARVHDSGSLALVLAGPGLIITSYLVLTLVTAATSRAPIDISRLALD